MSCPWRNASIRPATSSISGQEEPLESGNNREARSVAVTSGVEIKTLRIFGSPSNEDQSTATGPNGVLGMITFFMG